MERSESEVKGEKIVLGDEECTGSGSTMHRMIGLRGMSAITEGLKVI